MNRRQVSFSTAGAAIASALGGSSPALKPASTKAQTEAVNIEQAQDDLAFTRGVEAYIWAYPLAITAATAEIATIPTSHCQTAMRGSTASAMSAN